jgi:EAL domain-containing protein (putative c-di-GMP-specific phosphodiesterase class I)
VDILIHTLKKYNVSPERLHLEITESAYTENPKQIIDTVSRLRKVGFIVEMDDFGSGYSSLNMLNEMPIDILKLDMKFMQSETAKPVNQGVLRFIMDLARWMKLSVVAEGVETKEQLERLREIGCDYVQGYFFARPMPSLDFEKLMNEQRLSVTPDAAVGRADQHGSA